MNDQANLAIHKIKGKLGETLLAYEREFQNSFLPWRRISAARSQVEALAGAHSNLIDAEDVLSAEQEVLKTAVRKIEGDKAAKAIEGMLLYPNPHLKSEADPAVARDEVVREVAEAEETVSKYLSHFWIDPSGIWIASLLSWLREEARILALGYTKAQSDANARGISAANDKNFAQSMGDAYKFQQFLEQNFKNELLNHPGLKILEVAEEVIKKLMIEAGPR